VTGNDIKLPQVSASDPEVTSFQRKLPGSGCRRPNTVLCPRLCSYRAITQRCGSHVTENNVTSPQVTGSEPEVMSFNRKWPRSGCRRLKTSILFLFVFMLYKAVARRRRQSRDRKWRHVTSGDRKWPGSDVIWPEVTWKWL